MDQEQNPRKRPFIRFIIKLVPDWRPTAQQLLWTTRIAVVLSIVVGIGYYGVTLWDWIKLLVVPAVIATGGLWFNRQQQERALEVENQSAQDTALQAYLDQMSQLLTDKDRPLHTAQLDDNLSTVARARTLTVLTRLEGERKGSVVRFLYESGLITRDRPILNLKGANLIGTELNEANLRGVELSWTELNRAVLSWAVLTKARLIGAELNEANLNGAELSSAVLNGVDLREANLRGGNLSAASLVGANLSGAHLLRAYLGNADLREARGLTEEQLRKIKSLEGATMANGRKYEDWTKDEEGRKEDTSPK